MKPTSQINIQRQIQQETQDPKKSQEKYEERQKPQKNANNGNMKCHGFMTSPKYSATKPQSSDAVKNRDGQCLTREAEIISRLKEHFTR